MTLSRKKFSIICFFLLLLFCVTLNPVSVLADQKGTPEETVTPQPSVPVAPKEDGVVVIVIDPGHGGDNMGTQSGHTIEKEMNMITANAMYAELRKYDNVKVYLTHNNDADMSLKERAEFAAGVGADFLFSLHYNASEDHSMFGSEVWISCKAPYNVYGYQFGYEHLQSMADRGLFIRGVKNRQNDEGTDYYGIIRESVALSVPAVIIEHCYVDEERDADYIKNDECYAQFGRDDALSVAKYFGLKSTSLGVDYSSYAANLKPAPKDSVIQRTLQDLTAPDVCQVELLDCDYEAGTVSISVSAADYDNNLIYYNYSFDRGQTWSRLEAWPGCNTLTGAYSDTFVLNLKIPKGVKPTFQLRAYNITDLYRTSNTLTFDQKFSGENSDGDDLPEVVWEPGEEPSEANASESADVTANAAAAATEPPEHPHKTAGTTTFQPADSGSVEESQEMDLLSFLKISLVIAILIFAIVLISQAVNYANRKKRRRNH